MDVVTTLDRVIHEVGPWGYLALGASAMIEYLFPLFPGDTVTLLGGVYAARGEKPWPLVLFVVTLGSVLGAACDYWFGMRLGRKVASQRGFQLKRVGPEQLASLTEKMRRRGTWLLLINRFLPGIRPLLFVAAGAAKLPFGKVMALGAVSALVWNGAILGVGVALGGNVERVLAVATQYQRVAIAVVVVVCVFVLARFLARRVRGNAG